MPTHIRMCMPTLLHMPMPMHIHTHRPTQTLAAAFPESAMLILIVIITGMHYDGLREAARMNRTFERYRIVYAPLQGNLFAALAEEGRSFDIDTSTALFAEMSRLALVAEFPGAEIEVSVQYGREGGSGIDISVLDREDGVAYEPGVPAAAGRIASAAEEVTERVWQSNAWITGEK